LAGLQTRRQLLLTLHVIFPQLLLPALDLIDRRLISRLTLTTNDASSANTNGGADTIKLFVVQSSTPASTHPNARSHRAAGASAARKNYVVRLTAWNCTCANFAFDAFPSKAPASTKEEPKERHEQSELGALFGGMCLDGADAVPCCKHLLACLLAQRGGRHFADSVEDRGVTREELAEIVANS
jgi:hypothetical protein